jgi:hypothetical protein
MLDLLGELIVIQYTNNRPNPRTYRPNDFNQLIPMNLMVTNRPNFFLDPWSHSVTRHTRPSPFTTRA